MSSPPNEDRPKLKAKRFNKFESSSSAPRTPAEEKHYVTKQGFKRTRSDDDENTSFKFKKTCTAPNYNASTLRSNANNSKNSANARLKKLKENLQAELNSQKTNDVPTKVPTVSKQSMDKLQKEEFTHLSDASDSEHVGNALQKDCAKLIRNRENRIERKNFDLKSACSPPNQLGKKNLANERLLLLKKKLNEPSHSKSTNLDQNKSHTKVITSEIEKTLNESSHSKSTNLDQNKSHSKVITPEIEKPHCSGMKPNKEKIVGGFKRKISDVTNDPGGPDNSSVSKRLAASQSISSNEKINTCDTNIDNRRKSQIALSSDKPVKQHLPSTNDGKNHKEKSPVQTNTRDINDSQQNPSYSSPLLRNSDNFREKMAMTASWIIKNHQDVSKVVNSLESSGSSLSVNVDQSTDKLHFDETEDMEWTNAEPDEEIIDISKPNSPQKVYKKEQEKSKDVCIVVDTNVFLSGPGLSKIQDIMDLKVTGISKPLVYIPWMVMQELDYMKDSCSNNLDDKRRKNITNSIRFINNVLKQEHPRIKGQTVFEAEKQNYVGPSPDDKIISCCFQVSEKYESVILVSNDVNLINKAMINNLTACSSDEIMMQIMSRLVKTNKSRKVLHKMGILCSTVICECAKEAFGSAWTKMDMLSCPPWSLVSCLKRFRKYWRTVFSDKLMKQFTKTVDEMLQFLESNSCIEDNSEDFNHLMKMCITLCIFLKDIEACRGFIENTLHDITKLG